MPYIPHTRSDVELMLEAIGVDDIEALFDEIPGELSEERSSALSSGLSELEMMLRMQERASRDEGNLCFLGAGCYDHHIPSSRLGHSESWRVYYCLYALSGGSQSGNFAINLRIPIDDDSTDGDGCFKRVSLRWC